MKKFAYIIMCALAVSAIQAQDAAQETAPAPTREEMEKIQEDLAKLRTDIGKLEKTIEQKNKRLEPLLEATVQTSFGVDLNTMASGFNNTLSSSFKLTLLDEASKETIARGDVVGYIRVTDYKLELTNNEVVGAKGSVEAYIKAMPFFLKLWGKPSFSFNSATAFDAVDVDADVKASVINPLIMGVTAGYTTKGFSASNTDDDDPELAVQMASAGDLTKNIDNEYYFGYTSDWEILKSRLSLRSGANVNTVFGGIKFNQEPVPTATKPAYVGTYMFYLNPELTFDDIAEELTVAAAFDGGKTFDATPGIYAYNDFAWDANATVTLKLSDKAIRDLTDVWSNVSATAYFIPSKFSNIPSNLDAKLSFYEIDEADGFDPNFGGSVNVLLLNLLDSPSMDYAIYGDISYKIGKIKPYVYAGWNVDKDDKFDNLERFKLKVGTEFAAIPRAVFIGEFGSTDLLNAVDGDKGYLTVSTKIAY